MTQYLPAYFKTKPLALLVAISLGFMSNNVLAQEEAEEEYETIVITASKRSTGLQETPIAVTVTSAKDILQTKILDIGDLQS
ncbi:MAG: iron complex outermembrane receptor protein, partial [Glaciecola sp.]